VGDLVSVPRAVGRDVAYVAQLDVRVEDVVDAGRAAVDAVERAGGFLFAQQADLERSPVAVLTFKVPPESFRTVLDALGDLGEPLRQQVDAEDVTDQVVDLEGRAATARVSVERLRGFLERATSVQDVAALESELTRRETELEQLEGRLRVLRDRVDLATVTLNLRADAAAAAGDDGGLPDFTEALDAGWSALRTSASVVAVGVGVALPWLPLGAVAALAWRLLRWRGRRPGAAPRPGAAAPTEA
jgi:hypothetical protein